MVKALGIDIGGSGIKAALVDTTSGRLVSERVRVPTPQTLAPNDVLAAVVELIESSGSDGLPVGVGFPAVVVNGTVLTPFTAAQVESWVGCRAATRIAELSGRSVRLLNDADAAGLAEMRFGSGRDEPGVVIVLTLGTGIGSALFVDQRLVPNTEFGHLYLRLHERVAEHSVAADARKREGLKWKDWAVRLDEYLHHLERLFTPRLFILGGGVSRKPERFLPRLTVRARVEAAGLGNQAGIVGAAMVAVSEA
jgi:polyphosphate glucokinase